MPESVYFSMTWGNSPGRCLSPPSNSSRSTCFTNRCGAHAANQARTSKLLNVLFDVLFNVRCFLCCASRAITGYRSEIRSCVRADGLFAVRSFVARHSLGWAATAACPIPISAWMLPRTLRLNRRRDYQRLADKMPPTQPDASFQVLVLKACVSSLDLSGINCTPTDLTSLFQVSYGE